MKGYEHYEEAERLLDLAQDDVAEIIKKIIAEEPKVIAAAVATHANLIAAAQAHATLALVIATQGDS